MERQTLSEQARALQAGQVSSRELTQASLERIRELGSENPSS